MGERDGERAMQRKTERRKRRRASERERKTESGECCNYSYAYAIWICGDINLRDAMGDCSDRQGGHHMLRHIAKRMPPRERSKSKRK